MFICYWSSLVCIIAATLCACFVEVKAKDGSSSDLTLMDAPLDYSLQEENITANTTDIELINVQHFPDCDCGPNSILCYMKYGKKVCYCKDKYQQDKDGFCSELCVRREACKNGGKCENNACKCLPGTKGDLCDVIEGCESESDVARMCGYDYYVYCRYNVETEKSFCYCLVQGLSFDSSTKHCKGCQCGPDGNCSFVGGQKKCTCKDDYAVSDYWDNIFLRTVKGWCQRCGCGTGSSGCRFEQSTKICNCTKGYSQSMSQCKLCDCGSHGTCSFEDWNKICKCDSGFREKNGICEECDCGPGGECEWDKQMKKTCKCKRGSAEWQGQCKICQKCHWDNNIINCSFSDGKESCLCHEGYELQDYHCIDINECLLDSSCPSTTECLNTDGSYECICKKGYRRFSIARDPKVNGCTDIDECSELNTCTDSVTTDCINTIGSYYCLCKDGYITDQYYYEPEITGCVEDQTSWRRGYIVTSVLFGVIIVCLAIAIFKRSRPRT